MVTKEIIEKAYSYASYRKLIDKLLSENKTTGENHSQNRIDFTKLNVKRMERLDKTTALYSELVTKIISLECKQIWLVIAEAWCGDCAQNIPVLEKIALVSKGRIELKIILRDENPRVMDCVLSNGTRSVPKLIAMDAESLEVIGTWGPRPEPAQKIMLHWKGNKDKIKWEEFEKELHAWYAKDRTETLQREFISLIEEWELVKC